MSEQDDPIPTVTIPATVAPDERFIEIEWPEKSGPFTENCNVLDWDVTPEGDPSPYEVAVGLTLDDARLVAFGRRLVMTARVVLASRDIPDAHARALDALRSALAHFDQKPEPGP